MSFLWGKRGKSPAAPAAGGRGQLVPVQKVDRIEVVRNLVTRPPVYGGVPPRRQQGRGRGGGAGAAPLAPPQVGGGGATTQQGEDIDKKSKEFIDRVRRDMWFQGRRAPPA
jgi:hypothetical protein